MGNASTPAAGPRWVYGPVPSRRLGTSLGVDLVPFKTCTYDCVYCQLGRTTNKTAERSAYAPIPEVLAELETKLAAGAAPDWIALAGSGEPTLHAEIGDVIRRVRKRTRIPVAVLTNGALLSDRDVQDALLEADLVLPSLDAGDQGIFRYVNRPHPAIRFEEMVDGLVGFSTRFRGQVWLEVFLLGGVTGVPAEVEKIAGLVRRIRPSRVQLNTVSRPAAESFAFPVSPEKLRQFALRFEGEVDVLEGNERTGAEIAKATDPTDVELLALLRRRPCTLRGVAFALGVPPGAAAKRLFALLAAGEVTRRRANDENYYSCASRGAMEG